MHLYFSYIKFSIRLFSFNVENMFVFIPVSRIDKVWFLNEDSTVCHFLLPLGGGAVFLFFLFGTIYVLGAKYFVREYLLYVFLIYVLSILRTLRTTTHHNSLLLVSQSNLSFFLPSFLFQHWNLFTQHQHINFSVSRHLSFSPYGL